MSNRQINNAYGWACKVLEYSLDENIELLGTDAAKKKARRYLKLAMDHEKNNGSIKVEKDYLTDLLCAIKHAEL